MNITLVYKWGYDPEDAYVTSDGGFRWKMGKLVASDDDAAAIACAREVAEVTGGSVVGVTVGNGDASWAAARGAEKTMRCEEAMPVSDDAAMARTLYELVKAAPEADLVIMGDSIETAGVAPALAALLGIPCILGIREFSADPGEANTLVATRPCGEGLESIRFKAPCLVSVSAAGSEKKVPSMKEMLAARKKPSESVEGIEVGSAVAVAEVRPAEIKRAEIFEGAPDEAASQLVAALRADGIL